MNGKTAWRMARLALMLALGIGTMAQDPAPRYFRGVINDYSPASVTPSGPWEIRGPWSMRLNRDRSKADFSVALTMELSDYSRTPANINTAGSRMQHTHHITMEDGMVTPLSTGGFQVTGPAAITKDGGPVPFGASTLTVTITGGTNVEFSNITLVFDGGAPVHFGAQAIHGVVRTARAIGPDEAR
jgi:hypothetical protein